MTEPIKLPPLPEGVKDSWDKRIGEAMQDYARQAIELDRQVRGEPVAQITVNKDRSQTWIALKTQWFPEGKHLLYTAPQPQQQAKGEPVRPEICVTCNGSGMVDDGEIDCYENGEPYENGPVKCVKDCPDCTSQLAPHAIRRAELIVQDIEKMLRLFLTKDGYIAADDLPVISNAIVTGWLTNEPTRPE